MGRQVSIPVLSARHIAFTMTRAQHHALGVKGRKYGRTITDSLAVGLTLAIRKGLKFGPESERAGVLGLKSITRASSDGVTVSIAFPLRVIKTFHLYCEGAGHTPLQVAAAVVRDILASDPIQTSLFDAPKD